MHAIGNSVLKVDRSAIIVRPNVNKVVLNMEQDTGSALSMIPSSVYQAKFADFNLQRSDKVLRSFTGEAVQCEGMFMVNV